MAIKDEVKKAGTLDLINEVYNLAEMFPLLGALQYALAAIEEVERRAKRDEEDAIHADLMVETLGDMVESAVEEHQAKMEAECEEEIAFMEAQAEANAKVNVKATDYPDIVIDNASDPDIMEDWCGPPGECKCRDSEERERAKASESTMLKQVYGELVRQQQIVENDYMIRKLSSQGYLIVRQHPL